MLSFKGIAEGVENSNFLLRTEAGSYILTLYEKRVAEADLPFFLGLMEHLAERGIRCPLPVKARDGEALRRPAAPAWAAMAAAVMLTVGLGAGWLAAPDTAALDDEVFASAFGALDEVDVFGLEEDA